MITEEKYKVKATIVNRITGITKYIPTERTVNTDQLIIMLKSTHFIVDEVKRIDQE